MRFFSLAITLALLANTAPAHAQDDDDDVIVVEGQREITVGEVRRQARAITPRAGSVGEPIARFQQPVCVGVFGLAEEGARLVIDRIMFNAEQIGLPVSAEEGCIANIVVAVVPDPHTEFAQLREESSFLVDGLTLWEKKRVQRQEGPALAWNVTSTRVNDGQMRSGRPPVFESTQISRLASGIRMDIELSVVMVPAALVARMDGVTLADYATMRSLARTRTPIEAPPVTTILDLFRSGEGTAQTAATRLTVFDRAYLESLYGGQANRPMNRAMGDLGTRLAEAAAEGED